MRQLTMQMKHQYQSNSSLNSIGLNAPYKQNINQRPDLINQRLGNIGRSVSIDSPANLSIDRGDYDDENLYELPIKNLDTNEVIKI
jgi:hypothetical protein